MTAQVRVFRLVALTLMAAPVIVGGQGRAGGGPPAAGVGTPQQVPASAAAPEPTGPATTAISGVVVDASTGQPVSGAIVSLNMPGRSVPAGTQTRQLTDGEGRFAFVNMWGEAYTLSASKFGYLDGGLGREKSPADPLAVVRVAADTWMGNFRLPIWRPASISGAVRDEGGEPMVGILVRTLVRFRLHGRDELAAGPMTVTDDRGQYRIAGLAAGKYLVQVPSVQTSMPTKTQYSAPASWNTPDGGIEIDETTRLVIGRFPLPPPPVNGRPMAYPMAFYPSTSSVADAALLDVKYGDDRSNVDITLAPTPAVRVSGVVEGPPEAMALLTLRLLPAGLENLGQGSEAATALVDSAGRFTFVNVPSGTYTIDAPVKIYEFSQSSAGAPNRPASFPAPPGIGGWSRESNAPDAASGLQFGTASFRGNVPNYSGRGTVTVGSADLANVVVQLKPMVTVSGRIIIEADPAQPAPAPTMRLSVTLDPAGGEVYLGTPRSQLTLDAAPTDFTIPSVMPGQYWLRMTNSTTWLVKSVVWKGRDYATGPLDTTSGGDLTGIVVTVTNNKPALSGSVRTSATLKAEDCFVVVFPVERAQWRGFGLYPTRFKTASILAGNTYSITTLPPGDYFVAAIDRSQRAMWLDPAVLTQLEASAARVTLTWGGKITQEAPVVVIK